MPAESLVPGYKLVETFGPDSEYETRPSVDSGGNEGEEEVEEEVEYVTLEISGIADVDPNLLTSYRLIGVDTPTPFLQLSSSGTIFKGRHHKLLGTELLFSHAQDDLGPSARHVSLLGTTEQRIVFSPVEIRNPTSFSSSSSTSRSTSKTKTPGKESSSNSKKGKKKANGGAGGIEEVAGSLGGGVSKPSALAQQDPAVGSGPLTRSKTAGKKKDHATQYDDTDNVYATEDDEEGGGGGTFEQGVGGEECVGEGAVNASTDSPPRKRRRHSRNDKDKKGKSARQSTEGPMTTATTTTVDEPWLGQRQQIPPPTPSGTPITIDSALEALHLPENQPSPHTPASGTDV